MRHSICNHPRCENLVGKHGAKGLCPFHYRHSRGSCKIEGCQKKVASRSMCSMHYYRWRATGDPHKTPSGRKNRGPDEQNCSFEGCEEPRRKREWCGQHYNQWRATGEVREFVWKWQKHPNGQCVLCGEIAIGRSMYCSQRCQVVYLRHDGKRPQKIACMICGDMINLLDRETTGRFRRASIKMCDSCSGTHLRRHGVDVQELAKLKGSDCGICGLQVDMSVQYPEPDSPQVDHIKPYSLGGTHDLSNLQVSHARCNMKKNNRENFTLTNS